MTIEGLRGDPRVLAASPGLTVVSTAAAVAAYDDRGRRTWELRRPASNLDFVPTVVTDGVVLASWNGPQADRFLSPIRVRALDAVTGVELWRDDAASTASAADGLVFTGVCSGAQDEHVGDCVLSAREPRTGATLWSVPTYAVVQVEGVDGDALVVSTNPGGSPQRYELRDRATGTLIGSDYQEYPRASGALSGSATADQAVGRTTGCYATIHQQDLQGDEVWTRRLRVGLDEVDETECGDAILTAIDRGGPLLASVFQGPSWLLDPRTGSVLLRVAGGTQVVAVEQGIAVLDRVTSDLRSYGGHGVRIATGKVVWRSYREDQAWFVAGTHTLRSVRLGRTCVTEDVDVRSGRVRATYRGSVLDAGPGWLATSQVCGPDAPRGDVRVHRGAGFDVPLELPAF